jgi:hypothetical protein
MASRLCPGQVTARKRGKKGKPNVAHVSESCMRRFQGNELQTHEVAICLTQVAPNILRARPLVKPHILCLPE